MRKLLKYGMMAVILGGGAKAFMDNQTVTPASPAGYTAGAGYAPGAQAGARPPGAAVTQPVGILDRLMDMLPLSLKQYVEPLLASSQVKTLMNGAAMTANLSNSMNEKFSTVAKALEKK